jgi:crotonobetaine/carnitine-CoA ligase
MIAVVPRAGSRIDPVAVFEHCVAQIPRFAVPRYLRVMSELPKTASQRIEKYKLREEGLVDALDREALGIVAPRS